MSRISLLPMKWPPFLVGLILGVSAASQLLDFHASLVWNIIGFLILWLAGYGLADVLLNNAALSIWRDFNSKTKLIWIGICILAGFILLPVIPITIYPKPQEIRITATGDQNPLSNGSEVWVTGISAGRYDSPTHMMACEGDWVRVGQAWVSYKENQPSTLVCSIRTDEGFQIQFVTHPWSGSVRVRYDGRTNETDLYSDQSGQKVFAYEVEFVGIDRVFWYIACLSLGISLAFILFSIAITLISLPRDRRAARPKPIPWFGYGGLMIAGWVFYLLVFWPGFFSSDTMNQFGQIASSRYTDWHPIFHTLFLWLTTRFWFSPTPVILVQMLLLGGLLGWGLEMCSQRGTPAGITIGSAAFLSVSPAVGLTLLNAWKDVAYSIAIVAFVMILFRSTFNPASSRMGKVSVLFLIIASACIGLFRHNGPPVVAGSLILLILLDRKEWKSYFWIFISFVIIWGIVRGPVYSLLSIPEQNQSLISENLGPLSELVYLARFQERSGTELRPEDKELIDSLLGDDKKPKLDLLRDSAERVKEIAWSTTVQNPATTIRFFARKASFVFQILRPANHPFGYVAMEIVENPFGFTPNSKLPHIQGFLSKAIKISQTAQIDWLVWRNGYWMVVLILAGLLTSFKMKKWSYLAVIAPPILNALPYCFVGSPQSRYIFPSTLLGPVLGLCMLFLQVNTSEANHSENPNIQDGK